MIVLYDMLGRLENSIAKIDGKDNTMTIAELIENLLQLEQSATVSLRYEWENIHDEPALSVWYDPGENVVYIDAVPDE